jgi:hypothetical protein
MLFKLKKLKDKVMKNLMFIGFLGGILFFSGCDKIEAQTAQPTRPYKMILECNVNGKMWDLTAGKEERNEKYYFEILMKLKDQKYVKLLDSRFPGETLYLIPDNSQKYTIKGRTCTKYYPSTGGDAFLVYIPDEGAVDHIWYNFIMVGWDGHLRAVEMDCDTN